MGVSIGEINAGKKGVKVPYTDAQGKAQTLECDRLIVSVGRQPNTEGLGLEKLGLAADARGFIPVDDHCQTSVPGVWAVAMSYAVRCSRTRARTKA